MIHARAWAIYCWPEQKSWSGRDCCVTENALQTKLRRFAVPGDSEFVIGLMSKLRKEMSNITNENSCSVRQEIAKPEPVPSSSKNRICLDVESERVSILQDSIIHLHVKSCLSLTISPNDALPKEICVSCVSQLSEFYNFQLNARCSQDWLESSLEETSKKSAETKTPIQPLPDSEYNSDSLLEFLNNTANIEEYLNSLGKEDIPSIVNMLDRNNENYIYGVNKLTNSKSIKNTSPKKPEKPKTDLKMEVDVLDSDTEIVQELLMKETEPKLAKSLVLDKNICFACKTKCKDIHELSLHVSICDNASRTCLECGALFDSKKKMLQHRLTHNPELPLTCACGKRFESEELLTEHFRVCYVDYMAMLGCSFKCKHCGETFKERFPLYRHVRGHIMKAREKSCDICGHIFIGAKALSDHKMKEHNKHDKTLYKCKVCNETSSNRKEIYSHVLKHTAKAEHPRHLCESCGKSFATHTSLTRHSVLHKSNCYSCTLCKKTFASVSARDEHVLKHKEVNMCERCGMNVYRYELDAHVC